MPVLVDSSPSDLDDLFDFARTPTASVPIFPAAVEPPAAYPSRREMRSAVGDVSRRQVRASARAGRTGRGSVRASDRRIVVRDLSPVSLKLGRADIARMHAAAPKAPRKNPASVLAIMAMVGGLFAVAGLPAYAMTSTTAERSAPALAPQSIAVAADAVGADLERDDYEATTSAELEEMRKDALRAANNEEYLASGARELGDDYPWAYELSAAQGGGLSPLNYYYRECVDFVAWRLNRDAGSYAAPFKYVWSSLTPNGGNASQWKYAWEAKGWKVSDKPVVGSVAWFGWEDHVSYVKEVKGDKVLIEEYNFLPGVYGQRTLKISDVDAFLYPPD